MLSRERTPMLTALPAPAPLPSLTSALSRRAAIFGVMTAATAPVASLPALAVPPNPTSPLAAALQAEFKQLAHEESVTTERDDAAYARLKYPDAPEAIFCRADDMATLRWHTWDVDYQTKRRWWGEEARIARLRADNYGQYKSEINRKAAARRDEIVAAWDGWQVDKKAAEDRGGYTAAHAEWLAAADQYEAFRLRLINLPTTDRDVMAVKAAVVTERYTDEGVSYLDRAIERHLNQQDDLEALCFSIVRDFAFRSAAEPAHA